MTQSENARDRLTQRDWQMWGSYVKGFTQQQIADEHGVSQSHVSERLKLVRAQIPAEEREQVRRRHLDGISALSRELWALVEAGPHPAYSNGRRMTMPNELDPDNPDAPGDQVWDHSARMAAMDRIGKLMEREAKLLGLDAPTQQEISATVDTAPSIVARIEAAKEAAAAKERAVLERDSGGTEHAPNTD